MAFFRNQREAGEKDGVAIKDRILPKLRVTANAVM